MLAPPTLLLSRGNIEQFEPFYFHTHQVICTFAIFLEKIFLKRLTPRDYYKNEKEQQNILLC